MQPVEQNIPISPPARRRHIEENGGRGTDLHDMHAANRLLILNYIRERRTVPRSDLARYTGLSRTTIGNIVEELVREGAIYIPGGEGINGVDADRRTIPLS